MNFLLLFLAVIALLATIGVMIPVEDGCGCRGHGGLHEDDNLDDLDAGDHHDGGHR